jgi:recombination protein RecT
MAKKYRKESTWDTHFIPMGLKTVIRRLCNLLPKSPELALALAMDELNERGETQNIGITDAINGSWAPVIDDEPGEQDADGQGKSGNDSTPVREVGGKLGAMLVTIGNATTVGELDEVFLRAEESFEGNELEQLLIAYRRRKDVLSNTSSQVSDIFGETGK